MTTPPNALAELMTIVTGYQRSRALMIIAELGIADLLRDGPRSVDELARATHTHSPTLYRVLRSLAAVGVFEERPGRMLALTPISEFLRSDAAVPYGHLARLLGRDYQWAAWGALLHSVRTGESAAAHVLGMDVWAYRQDHPEESVIFNNAMLAASLSRAAVEAGAYDFAWCRTIADIGGGTGALLATILRMYPNARGILFDQPQVVAEAGPVLHAAGLTNRVSIEGGSFFERIPPGADAYVMRRILHDWTDEDASTILRCCRTAMTPEARLVLFERMIGPPNEDPVSKFVDLLMLVVPGGRERTEDEWSSLFDAGGFRLESVKRAAADSYAIVGAPV